jgi:hypothetical protein
MVSPFKACYLTTPSTPKIILQQRQMNNKVWSIGAMILTGEDQSTRRQTGAMAATYNINPTRTGQQ